MIKSHKIIACSFAVLFMLTAVLTSEVFNSLWIVPASMLLAFAVYLTAGRRSLIGFSISFIPALVLWLLARKCSGCACFCTVAVLSFMCAIAVRVLGPKIPQARESTRTWIGCGILLVILSMMPAALI